MEWFYGALFAAIIIGFYLTEGRSTVRELRLRIQGKVAVGTVTERWQGVGRYGPTYWATVDPDVSIGQKFPVRYLPSRPQVAVLSEGIVMLAFKTLVVILLTAIIGFFALVTIAEYLPLPQ